MIFLGSNKPKFILYLQHQNLTVSQSQLNRYLGSGELKSIVEESSNDWRKVCSIYSKIINGVLEKRTTWQDYLWSDLFQETGSEMVVWNRTELIDTDKDTIHIIAGKSNFEAFNLPESIWESVGELNKIQQWKNVFSLPYFDYRQFPNILVDEILTLIKSK